MPVVISDTEAVYLYGLDIIAQQQSERLYYVHYGLGSVRQLVDSTGQIQANYAYDPFGVPLAGGEVPNPYQFTGEAWDAEVELLYLRARYYQPETGRFVTKDPWAGNPAQPATLNHYVYAGNNPVNLLDPSGSRPEDFLPSWQDPPVVTHIHQQMVDNAQGPIVAQLLEWNSSWSLGMRPGFAKANANKNFADMVWPGHEWDPKDYIRGKFYKGVSHRIGGHWYYYDIWGNIMFGYLGSAAGFQEWELLNGGGLTQLVTDVRWAPYAAQIGGRCRLAPMPRPWHNFYLLWAFDHPQDRVTTRMGIRLWREHETGVKTRDIIEAVVQAGDTGEIERRPEPWPWAWS